MAAGAFSAVRRRNVSPVSSTLSVQTRDVDCSGLAAAPEDGEFVTQTGASPQVAFFGGVQGDVVATNAQASSLAMVWGSAQRSDRQALGDTRVSVLDMGGIDLDCTLYVAGNTGLALDNAANFPVGTLVSITISVTTIEGAATRLCLTPMGAADCGWSVGYVTRTSAQLPAADRAIGVYLYDKPRYVGSSN